MFKRFIKKIIANSSLISFIDEEIKENYVNRLASSVKLGENSKIYHQASVSNLQNNPSKIQIGSYTHIRGELLVFANGGSISIGDRCYIGEGSHIWSNSSISIGNDVLISHNVNIIDTNSHELDYQERALNYHKMVTEGHSANKGNVETYPIVIKDNAWINFNAIILKGVTIGQGAIIAAGSVVLKDVPDFVLVAGNPAVVIKSIK